MLALVGDAEAVNRVVSDGGRSGDPEAVGPATLNFLKGALALKQHRFDEATSLLSRSDEQDEDPSTTFLLGESYQAAGNWTDAAQQFRRLLDGRGNVLWNGVSVLVPLAYFRVGICDSKLGKVQEARSNLSQFLAIWSDQSRKEVLEARRTLALAQLPK